MMLDTYIQVHTTNDRYEFLEYFVLTIICGETTSETFETEFVNIRTFWSGTFGSEDCDAVDLSRPFYSLQSLE